MNWRSNVARLLTERPDIVRDTDSATIAAIYSESVRVQVPIDYGDLMLWAAGGATDSIPSRVVRCRLASERQSPYGTISHVAHGAAIAAVALFGGAQPKLTWYAKPQMDLIEALVAANVLTAEEISDLTNTYGYVTRGLLEHYGLESIDQGNIVAVTGVRK